jgi:alpha-galactosidase
MNEGQCYSSNIEIVSNFYPMDFDPDGKLNKSMWGNATPIRFDHDWLGQKRFPELETRVASLWTPEHFYFAFWCRYIELNTFAGEDSRPEKYGLWDRDVVEVFLNPLPEQQRHYYEFEVAPDNKWVDLEINLDTDLVFDHTWDSHFQHRTHLDEEARLWTCEMRIPTQSVGVPSIHPGWNCRINFYRCDGLGDDSVRRFLAWSPTLSDKPTDFFHVPSRFGVIRFVP